MKGGFFFGQNLAFQFSFFEKSTFHFLPLAHLYNKTSEYGSSGYYFTLNVRMYVPLLFFFPSHVASIKCSHSLIIYRQVINK